MNLNVWLTVAALIIIAGLVAYAWILWRRVWQRQRRKTSVETERNERLAGDIGFLAQSLLDDRLPMVEGSIRIKVLLDNYSGARPGNLNAQIFETIYEATAHIPTHQDWQALPKGERDLHLEHMEALEREYRSDVERAARQLSDSLGMKAPSASPVPDRAGRAL